MSGTNPNIDRCLALYDDALPEVYGYIRRRVDATATAEDIAAETFMAAIASLHRDTVVDVTVPWLIGIARHKVADHWRRQASEDRRITAASNQPPPDSPGAASEWDAVLDATLAHATLSALTPDHRSALSLRYLDGLPVGQVATHLGRTLGATEALLTRAKAAFRHAYPDQPGARHA